MKEFDIIRFYQNGKQKVLRRGVSESKAREWCSDYQSSSHTADKPQGCAGDKAMINRWHDQQKHWFDGFRESRL